MQILLNLFVIYVATSVEWFLLFIDQYFIHPNDEPFNASAIDGNTYQIPAVETAVFAFCFYILSYLGLIKIKNQFVLAITVVASDILYTTTYQPILNWAQIEFLTDHFVARVAVFVLAYSAFVIILSNFWPRFGLLASLIQRHTPSEETASNFATSYAVAFLTGLGMITLSLTVLFSVQFWRPGWVEAAFSWSDMLLLSQALPLTITPFLYLLLVGFSKLRSGSLNNYAYVAKSIIFAYISMFIFLLPIATIMTTMEVAGVKGAFFFMSSLILVFSLGISIYVFRDIWWFRQLVHISAGLIACFMCLLILVSVIDQSDSIVSDTDNCPDVATERATKAMVAQEKGFANHKSTFDDYYDTYLKLCRENRI